MNNLQIKNKRIFRKKITLNLLSRYKNKNNRELWQCLKRVLRYFKGSLKLKLIYKINDYKDMLVGFVDSNWAGNELHRKSKTGFLFQSVNQNTISWNTRRQNLVATSSFIALYEGLKKACWLNSLFESINPTVTMWGGRYPKWDSEYILDLTRFIFDLDF